MNRRIPANRVVKVDRSVVVASSPDTEAHPITVIPLVQGDDLEGLEIRCRCGAQAVVDCVYDPPDAVETVEPVAEPTEDAS